jgi:cytochrome bd-type quinol oxidase subunit 1
VPVRLFARLRFRFTTVFRCLFVLTTIGLSLMVTIGLALLVTVPLAVIIRLLVPVRAT